MWLGNIVIRLEIISKASIQKFDSFMLSHGFSQSSYDSCVYI